MFSTSTRPTRTASTWRLLGGSDAHDAVLGWAGAFVVSGLFWFGLIWAVTR